MDRSRSEAMIASHGWLVLGRSLLVGVLIAGCARAAGPLTPATLSGTYENSKRVGERLNLYPDGRFVREELKNGAPVRSSGRWLVERSAEGYEQLEFLDADSIWITHPERSFSGRLRIPVDPDVNDYFEKDP